MRHVFVFKAPSNGKSCEKCTRRPSRMVLLLASRTLCPLSTLISHHHFRWESMQWSPGSRQSSSVQRFFRSDKYLAMRYEMEMIRFCGL
jgi:hypothetical protein